MTTTTITIGWTKSSMPDYSSFGDGYKPGAEQHVETIEVEVPKGATTETIAWAALTATNAPSLDPDGLAQAILTAIDATGYNGKGAHYSLSTGDTVEALGKKVAFTGYAVEEVA